MAETAADIRADLVVLRAARTKLATGERIKEVMRSGRKLANSEVSLEDLTNLIAIRESDLAAAEAAEAGGKRRRAIRLGWPN